MCSSDLYQHFSILGKGIFTIFPSWVDPDGAWRVEAYDLTTGRKGEATVRKDNALAAMAVPASLDAFRATPPDLVLSQEPLPELTGFANFVPLKVALKVTHGKSVKARIRLRIPESCLISGAREQTVTLTPQKPDGEAAWELFIGR